MGRNEIISHDSLRVLHQQVQQAKQEIHNLQRRLSAFRNELDDNAGLVRGLPRRISPWSWSCFYGLSRNMERYYT